jgi:hypothetical protein
MLNNVESVANLMMNAHMEGTGPYDSISVLSELTSEDAMEFIRDEMKRDKLVMSVIKGDEQ